MKGLYDKFQGKEIDYSALKTKHKEKEPKKEELRYLYRVKLSVVMPKKPSSGAQKDYLEYLKSGIRSSAGSMTGSCASNSTPTIRDLSLREASNSASWVKSASSICGKG